MKRFIKLHLIVATLALLPFGSAMAEETAASVNLNDDKVTSTEAVIDQKQTQEANKFAAEQAKVINKVPGVNISPEELKEKPKKKGISLNPIRWIMGPVIQLQEQTVRLQQQMMKLTGPIAALQPAMLNLQNRVEKMGGQMHEVQSELKSVKEQMATITPQIQQTVTHMKGVDSNMGTVSKQMLTVQTTLNGTYVQLRRMRPDLTSVRSDIGKIRDPIVKIQEPLISMSQPIHDLDKEVKGVHTDITAIRDPLVKIEKPITSLDKQLTGLHSEISQLRDLLAMVLTSIFVAAVLIAIGTPVAAIFIWRNREKLLPKPKHDEHSEDELVGAGQGSSQPRSSRR
jgi:hypothetical protein